VKIDAIELTNFKAFDEIEVPLGQLTVLSGLNGSGKSSVVQALGLLRQSNDAGMLRTGHIALNGALVEIGTGRDLLFQGYDAAKVGIALMVSPADQPPLEWIAEVAPEADVLPCIVLPESGRDAELNVFDTGFQFLRADRITPASTYPISQHAIGTERFLGARGEYTAHFLLRYGEVMEVPPSLRHGDLPDAPGLLSQVNAWLNEFSPGVRVEPKSIPMTDLVRLSYSYRGKGVGYSEPMRATNVGFGLTHALPVVTACLSAGKGSLMVIENPEAQLQPRGQVAMGSLLALAAANGAQIIVESHSDHVLNGIRLAAKDGHVDADGVQLHFFRREPGGTPERESPALLPDGRLSFRPEHFFDQWERSLDRLLDNDG
jgi:predicted ATPase